MLRRIVQIRAHEYLGDAWRQRSFATAGTALQSGLTIPGMGFVESMAPIPNANKAELWSAGLTSMTRTRKQRRPAATTYNVAAYFDDEDAVARLKADRRQEVVEVYADLAVEAVSAAYSGRAAVGSEADVRGLLEQPKLSAAGLTGSGVRIVIVDTGIDKNHVAVAAEGWVPAGLDYSPGSATATDPILGHGTMCAHDARIAAPQATFHDYALLRAPGGMNRFLSDVLVAYGHLADLLDADGAWTGQPVVINNSWAVYDRNDDLPIGTPGNYSANLNHPVNQQIGTVASLGADIVFAAGNCGSPSPDSRCGRGDSGPGRSIHGANSHPDVVTVGGVTTDGRRLAYSSQGPGTISSRKPDLASYTHFSSSSAWPLHSGTSAAAPVLAGVIAALRSSNPARSMTASDLRAVLQRTARNADHPGWNPDFGHGVVDAGAVLVALGIATGAATAVGSVAPRKKKRGKVKKTRARKTKRVARKPRARRKP